MPRTPRPRLPLAPLVLRALLFVVVTACAAAPEDSGAEECADVPELSWHDFGQGFLRHHCQGCHASTTRERYGAPEAVSFDTRSDVRRWREQILEAATGESPTMPPAGGVPEDERQRLAWWLECNPP